MTQCKSCGTDSSQAELYTYEGKCENCWALIQNELIPPKALSGECVTLHDLVQNWSMPKKPKNDPKVRIVETRRRK